MTQPCSVVLNPNVTEFLRSNSEIYREVIERLLVFVETLERHGWPCYDNLEGRLKPSWETVRDPLRAALLKNIWHYHLGIPFYRDGDPKSDYSGKVSNAVAHLRVEKSKHSVTVEIIGFSMEHDPFMVEVWPGRPWPAC